MPPERLVTQGDLQEIKEDIRSLQGEFREFRESLSRIEIKQAENKVITVLETARELSQIKMDIARYKGTAGTELGAVSNKTAILWGIAGSGGFIIFGALISYLINKLFGKQ